MSFCIENFSNFDFWATLDELVNWLNNNTGVLALAIFIGTLAFGWISGIFAALMRRPKFCVRLIDGPTFSCTYVTGRKYNEYDEHQTSVALYLHVTNAGSAPSSIASIEIGYHWNLGLFSKSWVKNRIGWFWLVNQTVALSEFQFVIGDSVKIFPFLTQRNKNSSADSKTYLRVGEATNGVVYFEQDNSWGGCFPRPHKGSTKIKVRIRDGHGRKHNSTHRIPVVSLEEAKKYNPRFGETNAEIRGEVFSTDETQISRGAEGEPGISERQTRRP